MTMKMVSNGSQYGVAYMDADGNALDGSKTYKVHLPPDCRPRISGPSRSTTIKPVPSCKPTSSFLVSTVTKGLQQKCDGSFDIYFAPGAGGKNDSRQRLEHADSPLTCLNPGSTT